ncbi:MAG: hypothetical protein J3Q66DRAFT_338725 [Benniella sp.]|nr:MAG: hypothetical protein J3Q66DRAFT_338725 [Benniella sp.]
MTTLNKVDDFENVDLVDAMPPVPMPIQSMSNVPLEFRHLFHSCRSRGPGHMVASLIWYEYKRYLQYVHNITSSTGMKNVKAIEDAGLITPAQNKPMREHRLVIDKIKCRVRDERRQHPDLVLRTMNEEYPSSSGWSVNRLREHCTERLKQRAGPRSNDKPTLVEDFAFELSRDLE